MKLTNLVVVSMSVLGLTSTPVLAATKAKTVAHHKPVHHVVAQDQTPMTMPAPVVVATPMIDNSQIILDSMTQNLGRQVHASPDWFQRIAVIGGANVDFMWGQRSRNYMGENTRRISLNDAYLNATALVNDWTKAFLSVSFNNASPASSVGGSALGINFPLTGNFPGVYSAAYTNNRLDLEQGYITFGNFNCTPFFVQLGKQFQDFGRYQIHPITRTLAQVMSESLQTSAKLGFIAPVWGPMSLHGSAYTFDNALRRVNLGHTQNVWGAALGVDMPSDQLGFDLGIGYMSNLTGVNDIAYAISAYETLAAGANPIGTYNATVGGFNVYGDINSGPFAFGVRYTTALQAFNPLTLSNTYLNTTTSGARPWAADFTAAYGFNAWCRNQNIYLGYQTSNDTVNLFLPKQRWLVGYGVEMWKNTNLGLEFMHDSAYSSGNGVPVPGEEGTFTGSSTSSNQVHARAAVKFG